MAIHEYAPGSELVAGGVLWRCGGHLPAARPGTDHPVSYTVCRGCQHYREGGEDLEPACTACGRPADGPVREYCVPEFGFVADPRTGKPGSAPPQRSWNGAVHVVSLGDRTRRDALAGPDAARSPGATPAPAAGWCHWPRGPAAAGSCICDWCGWGGPNHGRAPRSHVNPLRGKPCTGPLRWRSLAHTYETDILRLRLDAPGLEHPGAVAHAALRPAGGRGRRPGDQPRRHRRRRARGRRRQQRPGAVRHRPRRGRQRAADRRRASTRRWRPRCAGSARATAAWRRPATAACARRATSATTRT